MKPFYPSRPIYETPHPLSGISGRANGRRAPGAAVFDPIEGDEEATRRRADAETPRFEIDPASGAIGEAPATRRPRP